MRDRRVARIRRLSKLTLVLLVVLVSSFPLWCQVTGGTFTGVVKDSTNSVIPDTRITIKALATGVESIAQSSSAGVYSVSVQSVGQYKLTAERKGFKSTILGPVTLDVNATVRADFVLQVGIVTESVEVQGGAGQVLQAETGEISQSIEHDQIANMPLNGRDYTALIGLSGGTTVDAVAGGFNINGQRSQGNNFTLDGISTVSGEGHGNVLVIPNDAVQEFSIQQNAFSAQFGNVAGGVVSIVTKSGSNSFHGAAFEYLRNDAANAQVPFSTSKPKLRFNQFGGSVGGPIFKNKTFFFADYQANRIIAGIPMAGVVPTLAERNGDFSQGADGLTPIFDPTSGDPSAALAQRTQFSYNAKWNVMQPDKISAPAQALLKAMPLPNFNGTGGINFRTNRDDVNNQNAGDVRIDHAFSEKHHTFGRLSESRNDHSAPSVFGPGLGGGGTEIGAGYDPTYTWNISLNDSYVIKNNLANEFRTGIQRWRGGLFQENYGKNLAAQIGLPGVNTSLATSGLPLFWMVGASNFGDSIASPDDVRDTTFTLADNLTWTHGRHTIHAGFEWMYESDSSFSLKIGRGIDVFHPFTTGSLFDLIGVTPGNCGNQPCNPGFGGNIFASFLTGYPIQIQKDWRAESVGIRFPMTGLFFQDDWKVTDRFTLNLGLRYDLLPPYHELHNRMANFDPATVSIVVAGQNGQSNTLRNSHYTNFGPRVGFAWSVDGSRKTVLRGGFGISYSNILNMTTVFHNLADNAPSYYESIVNEPNILGVPHVLPNISQGTLKQPIMSLTNLTGGISPYYVNPKDPSTYTGTWNLGIQRSLSNSTKLELAYTGAVGVHLLHPLNLNQGGPGPVGSDPGTRRPFGEGIGSIEWLCGCSHSTYNAMLLKFERHFSDGLSILSNYTWSKSIDDQSGGLAVEADTQNPFNTRAERASSQFDRTHRLVVSGVYDLPFGRGRAFGGDLSRGMNALLGGWQSSLIFTAETGMPFTVTEPCTDIASDGGGCRPNLVGDPNKVSGGRGATGWFNTAAFQVPTTPEYGNAGRNILRGPADWNADLGISKYFLWGRSESDRLQFRADMFNVLNHTNLGLPVSDVSSPAFGTIQGAGNARTIQVGLRLEF